MASGPDAPPGWLEVNDGAVVETKQSSYQLPQTQQNLFCVVLCITASRSGIQKDCDVTKGTEGSSYRQVSPGVGNLCDCWATVGLKQQKQVDGVLVRIC